MADTRTLSAEQIADYIRVLFVTNKIIPANDKSFTKNFLELGQNFDQSTSFDVLVNYINTTDSMKNLSSRIATKFKGIDIFKKNFPNTPAPSYAEYMSNIKSYDMLLSTYGATRLADADPDFYANLIGNGIDPKEFNERMDSAVTRVLKADDVLKTELLKSYPGASLDDIAHSMLLGKDKGAKYLKDIVNQTEVRAEFSNAGLTATDVTGLANLDLDQTALRAGAQTIAQNLPRGQQLAESFGLGALTQQEMEAEIFKGLPSERRAKLNELQKAQFSGTSGVGSTSFSQRRAGQI